MAKKPTAAAPTKKQRKVAAIENGTFKNKSGTYQLKSGKICDENGDPIFRKNCLLYTSDAADE